jgi:hypothetical protein
MPNQYIQKFKTILLPWLHFYQGTDCGTLVPEKLDHKSVVIVQKTFTVAQFLTRRRLVTFLPKFIRPVATGRVQNPPL